MAKLHTSYLGRELPNPIIAGSCGLTGTLTSLKMLEDKGIGGVVLKSLFEEQILMQIQRESAKGGVIYGYESIDDYIAYFERKHELNEYMNLIRRAKEALSVPVIASINCVSDGQWQQIARTVEEAGADALQLNIFVPPYGFRRSGEAAAGIHADPGAKTAAGAGLEARSIENEYLDIVSSVSKSLHIPVTAKIGYYLSDIIGMSRDLVKAGAEGVVLFNRYYPIDFDVETMEISSGAYFSGTEEISLPLRWISLLTGEFSGSLVGATGVHGGDGVIKMLLAGADAVEIASVLYSRSPDSIAEMVTRLERWMDERGFASIDDFRGKLSRKQSQVPAEYTRMQYMKRYGDLKGEEKGGS
jgi:dihydroorotate dehydrogenase (fumarate)